MRNCLSPSIFFLILFLSKISCGSEPESTAETIYTACYSYNGCNFKSTSIKIGDVAGKVTYNFFNSPKDDINGIEVSFIENAKEIRVISIHKFLKDGSFYPIIEAVSGYISKKGVKKIIIITTSKDIYGKSLVNFKGKSYEIYIADIFRDKNQKIQIKEDKKSLNGVRLGQVGKWDSGEVERFKFTTINAIKRELKKDELE
ncbi:hypothetical protein KTJ34_06420 [Acinetobacter courvalinii]|uniref:hypothetical protein n=1 Tax=Acinetobacter courvalinii TaxID=280147 RepID=UPI0021D1E263|nr:hypothetical protein [Acinetobacter courvalinii]MCU4577058.1 hypothetical protein [Acinetobacter courvalinii]